MISSQKDTKSTTALASIHDTSAAGTRSGAVYQSLTIMHQSIFGEVHLVQDKCSMRHAVMKISRVSLDHGSADWSVSARGKPVLENVRKEVSIMRFLSEDTFAYESIDHATCGLSVLLLSNMSMPHTKLDSSSLSLREQHVRAIKRGQLFIGKIYDDYETKDVHTIVLEYARHGDLFANLTRCPGNRTDENKARVVFRELCTAVRYMHSNSTAHMDISLENVCLHEDGSVRVIDFGLATRHALALTALTSEINPTAFACGKICLLASAPSACECSACTVSIDSLVQQELDTQNSEGASIAQYRYLCRPVCLFVNKPGKTGYMSFELANNRVWDAYKNDCYALGVVLFSLLVGHSPYALPSECDLWFNAVYSGNWLRTPMTKSDVARAYMRLSNNALSLLDSLIAPQHMRPTVDELMRHAFFHDA